jgi:hypothetical protein
MRDAAISLTLGAIAATAGASYLGAARRSAVPFYFYQPAFGPSVMAACGRGFVEPLPAAGSPLAKFLAQETDRFDCRQLDATIAPGALSAYQLAERYLLLAAAGVWRITGVSWRSVDVIAAVLIGASIALVYLVFRLVLPRWLSAGLALLWLTSPAHLYVLTALRDYSKAPFFVLTILVIGTIILKPLSAGGLMAVSALLGAALGIGFGFRTDVMVNLAPFVLTVALFAPGGVMRRLRTKLAALAVCFAAFWVCARPVVMNYQWGNAGWHLVLLGTTDPFDQRLGVSPSVYSFGNAYSDDLVQTIVKAHAWRVEPDNLTDPDYFAPAYEQMTRRYFLDLARTFPADGLTRSWGSVIEVLNLPFSIAFGRVPGGVSSPLAVRAYDVRAWCLTAAEGITPMLLCALVVVLATHWPRYAFALAALVLFFAAYPVLQYDGRHVFHLEFLALWIDALAVWGLISNRAAIRRLLSEPASLRRMCLAAVAIASLMIVPLWALRLYQTPKVLALLSGYSHAREDDVPVVTKMADTARLDISGIATPDELRVPIAVEMLAVHVSGASVACRTGSVDLVVRYLQRDNSSRPDFSHMVRVPAVDGTVAYIPVYVFARNPYLRFAGLETSSEGRACVSRVSRLEGADRMHLLLESVVAERPTPVPLYQRLSDDTEAVPPRIRSAIRRLSRTWMQ